MASLLRLRRWASADALSRSYTSSGMFFSVRVVGIAESPGWNLYGVIPVALQRASHSYPRHAGPRTDRIDGFLGIVIDCELDVVFPAAPIGERAAMGPGPVLVIARGMPVAVVAAVRVVMAVGGGLWRLACRHRSRLTAAGQAEDHDGEHDRRHDWQERRGPLRGCRDQSDHGHAPEEGSGERSAKRSGSNSAARASREASRPLNFQNSPGWIRNSHRVEVTSPPRITVATG
jgi:hypothetical protein